MYGKLIIANFKEMFRDKMLVFWFLLFPIIFVLIFGVLFSNIGKGPNSGSAAGNVVYDIGIASKGEVPLTDAVKMSFELPFKMAGMFNVHTDGRTGETEAFKNGKRHALLLVPTNFIENIRQKKPVSIDICFDETHTEVLFAVSEIVKAVEKSINGTPRLIEWKVTSSIEFNQKISTPAAEGNKEETGVRINQLDFFLPGVLALVLMQLGLFGSMRILTLKSQHTLRTLGTTPMPRTIFLASEIIVRLIWSLVQGIIIVLLSHFVFNVTLSGSWLTIIGWIILGTSTFIAMGYMFTTFVKTPESGNALMQAVQFPMMFLAGIFIPPEIMPGFIRPVVNFIPLTYLADGLRNSMAGITSAYGTAVSLLVLTGVLMLCLVVTAIRFKWE